MVRSPALENFATFRAAHPSLSSAVEACTRPDWLVRLAAEAIPDRSVRLRLAVYAARLLIRDKGPVRLLRPWPGPLEALEMYTEYPSFEDKSFFNWCRAIMLALFPAGLLNLFVNQLVWQPENPVLMWLVTLMIVLVLTIPFAFLFRTLLAHAVRRQVATLDDTSALDRSLVLIERGAAKHPGEVRYVMDIVRTEIAQSAG
jgi:hypothetical protein